MRRLGIALATTALLLAACSGGEESEEPTGAEGTADDQGAADGSAQQELEEAGLLEDGAVAFGPTTPGEEFDPAICDYVFGTPEELGEVVGVPGQLERAGGGAAQHGGNGSGVQCTYAVDGAEALVLRLWDQELEVDPEHEDLLIVQAVVDENQFGYPVYGLAGLSQEDDGSLGLDEDTATALLEDAATRWSGGSA